MKKADGTAFTKDDINNVFDHLLANEHPLSDYAGGTYQSRFDVDANIAEAWDRLRAGRPVESDIVLLEHEILESRLMGARLYHDIWDCPRTSKHIVQLARDNRKSGAMMAISSFFAKLQETAEEVTYSFGKDREQPDDILVFDKTLLTAEPMSGLRTFGFEATARGICRRYRHLREWPDNGYIAS